MIALLGLSFVLLAFLPASVAAQDGGWYYIWNTVVSPNYPDGWTPVTVFLSPSGCEGCECSGSWAPGSAEGLMERPVDRVPLGHNEPGIWTPTWDARDVCPPYTDLAGDLTAGTWYHNANFDLDCSGAVDCTFDYPTMTATCTRFCSWGGMQDQGWVFIEDDNCCPSGDCAAGADGCPADSWTYGSISASNWHWMPEHPVVLGQDPSDLGVNVFFDLTLPPATHTWYEEEMQCRPAPPPLPGETPEPPICTSVCIEHNELVRDAISNVQVAMELREESRAWIADELAARYPNAEVRNPTPSAQLSQGCYYTGVTQRCHVTAHFDTEDPGYYALTAGATATLNGGRSFNFSPGHDVLVYLKDSTLVPDN